MSWQITQGSTTVTLPLAPQTVTDEAPTVDDTTITVPEQEPVLVSIGSDIRQLLWRAFLTFQARTWLTWIPIMLRLFLVFEA